jgi:hypothetical protein
MLAKMVVWHGSKTNKAAIAKETAKTIRKDSHLGSGSQSNNKTVRV